MLKRNLISRLAGFMSPHTEPVLSADCQVRLVADLELGKLALK